MLSKISIIEPVVRESVKKSTIQKYADTGIITPSEVGDLQGSLIELNKDDFNANDRSSSIDVRTRLDPISITSCVVIDNLTQMNFLPLSVKSVTLATKRLRISQGGLGRQEIVKIVQGKQEQDGIKAGGMTRGIMNVFKKKEDGQ